MILQGRHLIRNGMRWIIIAMIGVAMTDSTHAQESAADLVQAATQAMREENYDRAIEQYRKARQAMPHRPEIPYNLGFAHYRSGDFASAAEAFKQSASLSNEGSLRSRAIYNMGNSAYAQSLQAMNEQADPTLAHDQLKQASELLTEALTHYKKAIDSDPRDEDARANAELSHQLLKQLRKLQEQQQQQQQQSQDGEQQGQQDQEQDQNQSEQQQSQQSQQQSDQAEQTPDQEPTDSQPQSSAQQTPSLSDEDQEQQASDQSEIDAMNAEAQPNERPPPQDQGEHVQHPNADTPKRSMTRDEAERLLQSVRDKERARRHELGRRESIKQSPVEKDW